MKEKKKRNKRLKVGSYYLLGGVLSFVIFPWLQAEAARPLATDDAGTVERGAFELEMGYDFSKDEDHTQNQSLGISLKYGVIERLDLGIGLPYEIKPEEEFGNAEAGLKYLLLKEKKTLPALSLTFAYESGSSEYALTGIGSKKVGDLIIHINLGYITSDIEGDHGMTVYAGAIEYALSKGLTLVTELVGQVDIDENALEGLVGGNYQISEQVVLDFAIGKGFYGVSAKEGKATLGLTCGF
jgi:hypothetical protein